MRTVKAIGAAAVMMMLILDSKCALAGATEGLELCIRRVIPTLFPFFVLSTILTTSITKLPKSFLKLFRISPNAGAALLTGLLGGYPVGARAVSQAYENGAISKVEARRLLPICNQCGPSFIFGMGMALFSDVRVCLAVWLIQLFSAVLLARILPATPTFSMKKSSVKDVSLPEALKSGLYTTATVCGWVILFRILFRFLERWFLWSMPPVAQISLCGLLELANGFTELSNISNVELRFVLCVIIASFGGVCVSMQTFSVLHPDLDRRAYFPGKVLQASIGALLATVMIRKFRLIPLLCVIICGIYMVYLKITVAFQKENVYNDTIKDARILLCSSEKR